MNEDQQKLRRANLRLAAALGIFVLLLVAYSMRFIWPYVDISIR